MTAVLNILLSGEERNMIRKGAIRYWEKKHPPGSNNVPGDQKYPLQRPDWQNNNEQDRRQMQDLREIVVEEIKEAVPRNQNINKAFDLRQEKDKAPSTFLQRLKDQMRKYSIIDPGSPAGEGILKVNFVTCSWPDIKKKYRNQMCGLKNQWQIFCQKLKKYM